MSKMQSECIGLITQVKAGDGTNRFGFAAPDRLYSITDVDALPEEWQQIATVLDNLPDTSVIGALVAHDPE